MEEELQTAQEKGDEVVKLDSENIKDDSEISEVISIPEAADTALPAEPPKPEITYPLKVIYCGNCGLPPEYCEYFPIYEKCRQWQASNLPSEELGNLTLEEKGQEEESKGRQKRGGKALVKQKAKKTEKSAPKNISIFRAPRGKKKSVTVVSGLLANGIDLKVAAKYFGSKFACGSSVTGEDEIVIQGDVKDELFDVIPEKWPEIDEDRIDDDGDHKRA